MKKGFTLVILSLIVFPAALWGLAWYFSSAHTAAEYCVGEFSIFHPEDLCRNPHIALWLSFISAFISFFMLGRGVSNIKKNQSN